MAPIIDANGKAAKRITPMNTGTTNVAYEFPGQSVGVRAQNAAKLVRAVQKGLPFSAITTLVRESGLPTQTIADTVRIPARTLARRKHAGRFDQTESERLLRLAMIFETALQLFSGDREATRRWLTCPAKAFAGETPLSMTQTEVGAREVEDLIGRLEHGVFS
jgi:putative toxin-antitoxin system antitoxin component (TIGR02293 family)